MPVDQRGHIHPETMMQNQWRQAAVEWARSHDLGVSDWLREPELALAQRLLVLLAMTCELPFGQLQDYEYAAWGEVLGCTTDEVLEAHDILSASELSYRTGGLERPGTAAVVCLPPDLIDTQLATGDDPPTGVEMLSFTSAPVEEGGVDLGEGVRLGPARDTTVAGGEFRSHRIYRGDVHIGTVDYRWCSTCMFVVVGEIGLVETEQRRGIGTQVLETLRHDQDVAWCRWAITPAKRGSEQFWERIRAQYPGEYRGLADDNGCQHMKW